MVIITITIVDVTPTIVTTTWTCAFWEQLAYFYFSFRSLI
jgi:hypothetical protein